MVQAKVVFDYEAEKDDELSLKEGEIIDNIKEHDGGWWEGDLKGKTGWFPDNFVEIIKEAAKAPPPAKAPAKPPPPASAPKSNSKKAKCTFDYDAEKDDELSLKQGDIVTITSQEEEGWWEGELNGKKGMFPSNFVEEIKEGSSTAEEKKEEEKVDPVIQAKKVTGIGLGTSLFAGGIPQLKKRTESRAGSVSRPPKPAAPAPAQAVKPPPAASSSPVARDRVPSSAGLIPPPKKEKAGDADSRPLFKVTFDYEKANDDELDLKVGEFVRVTKQEDEGWWEGELVVSGRSGWFPDNFVEPATAEEKAKHAPAPTVAEPPRPPKPGNGPRPPVTKPEEKKAIPPPKEEKKAALPPPPKKEKAAPPKVEPKNDPPPTSVRAPSISKKPPPVVADKKPVKPKPASKAPKPAPVKATPKPDEEKSEDNKPPWMKEQASKAAAKPATKPPAPASVVKPPATVSAVKPPAPASGAKPASSTTAAASSSDSGASSAALSQANKKAEAAEKKAEEAMSIVKGMKEDMEKLRKLVKVLTSDVDEERAARLKMQVEIDRLKKLNDI